MELVAWVTLVWALLSVVVVGVVACMGRVGHVEDEHRHVGATPGSVSSDYRTIA